MRYFESYIDNSIKKLKDKNLYRQINYIDSSQDRYVYISGKKLLLLSSNNYLGLCNDKRVKKAAILAIEKFGCGSGGSRLTTGSHSLYNELEESLARFKGKESAIVFNTGYMANIGVLTAIADRDWVIFSDELNHASIIDGCRLSKAKIIIYKHCDMVDLDEKVRLYSKGKNIIVTDGVFSMDGDIAPLREIVNIAKKYKNIMTIVDDAHGTGVLGERGTGLVEYFDIKDEVDIQIGTLSKALGSEGGFVVGSRRLINYLKNKSRSFIYTTALSPASIASSIKSIEIISKQRNMRKELLEKSRWFKDRLQELGFDVLDSKTPIIPIIVGNSHKTLEFSQRLFEEGLYVQAIRPPTVKEGTSRLRITIMSTHTMKDLEFAIDKLYKIAKEIGVLEG
ncbi:8-amino-7-oxononanoate synthase BioF [Gottschalkia acidurici 9a]|uniref:8-amino-7-ketopelargonate synthase n=1 Tax=Gottschalkia acidurici (strain ATCC 7906 / DSM 604 / BCRC 14475 / CIP 104303 / KCTC 5404 / NCIMB 10678 / 9a) TaxID=1128398 RepID=K0B0I2_GOTA9|nr:8-amino-7-oxononanoate synthase [Gottschalkia acidurici]AFS79548.1 8-amino-7-oxononanoate synthase BioF [Gottschalkia acidurici 9a]